MSQGPWKINEVFLCRITFIYYHLLFVKDTDAPWSLWPRAGEMGPKGVGL